MRRKSRRRSQADKARGLGKHTEPVVPQSYDCERLARHGTGYCHIARRWPLSPFTGLSRKLAIPALSPDKKFVLLVGDCQLRSIADGLVAMPEGCFSFGVMCTTRACAVQLRTEVLHAELPRTPDAVCVVAPSCNPLACMTIEQSGMDFGMLLSSACGRWPKVFVMDFLPCLNVKKDYQKFLREEYHRVAARMGIVLCSTDEHFPSGHPELWGNDGTHLSDSYGMPVFARLLWAATYYHLETPLPTPAVASMEITSPRGKQPRPPPHMVVKEEDIVSRSPPRPCEWTVAEPDGKRTCPGEPECSSRAHKRRMGYEQDDGTQLLLRECFIPLRPVQVQVDAMGRVVPAQLCSRASEGRKTPDMDQTPKVVPLKCRQVKKQVSPCDEEFVVENLHVEGSTRCVKAEVEPPTGPRMAPPDPNVAAPLTGPHVALTGSWSPPEQPTALIGPSAHDATPEQQSQKMGEGLHSQEEPSAASAGYLKKEVQHSVLIKEEQQEWSLCLDQQDPEHLHIKEEKEDLWISPEVRNHLRGLHEDDVTKFAITHVPVKSEDYEEKKPLFHQTQTKANNISSGGSEQDGLLVSRLKCQSGFDDMLSNSSEVVTEESSGNWKEIMRPQTDLNIVKTSFPVNDTGRTDKKSFSCSVCSKSFAKKNWLQIHMRIHTGERPHSCSICGIRFARKGCLTQHLKIHTREKPCNCPVCGERFPQRGNLTSHMTVHLRERSKKGFNDRIAHASVNSQAVT